MHTGRKSARAVRGPPLRLPPMATPPVRCPCARASAPPTSIPRPGVGRRSTTTAAVRVPHPWRAPRPASLVHHPAPARGLPPRLRRFRPVKVARFTPGPDRKAAPDPGTSAIGSRWRPRSPRPRLSRFVRPVACFDPNLGFVGGSRCTNRWRARARYHHQPRVRRPEQGHEEAAASALSAALLYMPTCRPRPYQ